MEIYIEKVGWQLRRVRNEESELSKGNEPLVIKHVSKLKPELWRSKGWRKLLQQSRRKKISGVDEDRDDLFFCGGQPWFLKQRSTWLPSCGCLEKKSAEEDDDQKACSLLALLPGAMLLQKAWRQTVFWIQVFRQFTRTGFQEHSKKFKVEDMQASMEGKNCLVTGANSGIGFAVAEGLASRGAAVYIVCRSKERGEAALSKIQSTTGNQNVHLEICDLSSISEVKSFASRFSAENKPLHVLVNNAGILENNRVTTEEGMELNFAVNVAATYSMTELMMPLLEKAAPYARVITVSSGGMYTTPLTRDLQYSERKFDGIMQYSRNKRVQVALNEKWAQIYQNRGVGFYSMHPGWAQTPGVAKSLPGFYQNFSGKLRTSEEGADTVVWLALQPKENLSSGAFYFDRAEAPKHLLLAGTSNSHSLIDSIVEDLRSICSLSSSPAEVAAGQKA